MGARKWRSQTFDDVVGQDHVVRTLKNAIARGCTESQLAEIRGLLLRAAGGERDRAQFEKDWPA